MVDDHLNEQEISGFLDGSFERSEARRISEHLRVCKRCFEDYLFAARTAGTLETNPEMFAAPPPAVNVLRGAAPKRILRFAVVAAALVAVVTAATWWAVGDAERQRPMGTGGTSSILSAMQTVSDRGSFVIPGTTERLAPSPRPYRSWWVENDEEVSKALLDLLEDRKEGEPSPDAAFWLVGGFFATGQLATAGDIATTAIEEHPDRTDIAVLAALVSYFEGDTENAEAMLRDVLERDGSNVARLNLAVVLAETGRSDEARAMFAIVENQNDGPLAARANSLRSSLPQ